MRRIASGGATTRRRRKFLSYLIWRVQQLDCRAPGRRKIPSTWAMESSHRWTKRWLSQAGAEGGGGDRTDRRQTRAGCFRAAEETWSRPTFVREKVGFRHCRPFHQCQPIGPEIRLDLWSVSAGYCRSGCLGGRRGAAAAAVAAAGASKGRSGAWPRLWRATKASTDSRHWI